jgi:adenine-specific DNA-methyltransferase
VAYLNSTFVDAYFRQFNGHTQVNATDLRNLRYPSVTQLERLGEKVGGVLSNNALLDGYVEDLFSD